MRKIFAFVLFVSASVSLPAVDFWQFPEAAEKNSLFANTASPYVSFAEGFTLVPPEFSIDYLLPFFLPLSAGIFFKTPSPNLKSFGTRAAYHINLGDSKTDLYLLYVSDFGFLRNKLLSEYNDEEQPIRFFDFRFGVRRRFNNLLFIFLESDYKIRGLILGLSLKLF